MNVVPDTSVVIDGRVSATIDDGQFEGAMISVPEAVVAELEAQANDGIESGWDGWKNSSASPTSPMRHHRPRVHRGAAKRHRAWPRLRRRD